MRKATFVLSIYRNGEPKGGKSLPEWHVARIAEWHNYAEYRNKLTQERALFSRQLYKSNSRCARIKFERNLNVEAFSMSYSPVVSSQQVNKVDQNMFLVPLSYQL